MMFWGTKTQSAIEQPAPALAPVENTLFVRWMSPSDLLTVLRIDRESNPIPWGEDVFRDTRELKTAISLVATRDDQIYGFAVVSLHPGGVDLLNLCVTPGSRRSGVGRALIDYMKVKYLRTRIGVNRKWITVIVHERLLAGQHFFREMGFHPEHPHPVVKEHYGADDGFLFEYHR